MENNENTVKVIIQNSIATKRSDETFYITKDNLDGSREVVCRLKCDQEQAHVIFNFIIREQQKEYRDSNFTIKWRVIRMFDEKTQEQICWEASGKEQK